MFEGDNDLLNKYAGSPAFQSPEVLNHGKCIKIMIRNKKV